MLLLCPYHDDTNPSLAIYEGSGRFVCYSCGARGSASQLLGALEGAVGAIHTPPPRSASGNFRHRPQWTYPLDEYAIERAEALGSAASQSAGAISYLESRGISDVADLYGLGYDNGWIIFPVIDRVAIVQGMVARALPYRQRQTSMRYDVPSDQGPLMYVPDWRAVEDAPEIYIAFGIIDAISLTMVGLASVSPTLGKGSFDGRWLDFHNHRINAVPDRDEYKTGFELSAKLDWRGRVLRLRYPSDCEDPNDILAKYGEEALRDAVDQSKRGSGRSYT